MSNRVVAILSVLKPVDDTRNYEKIAVSLSNTNKYDINIIGFSTKKIPLHQAITFHPLFNFRRTSFARVLSPWKIWQILYKQKPELIIVTCAELLAVTCLHRIIFGTKVIYDVQENYYRNILYSGAYPKIYNYPIAYLTRAIERVLAPLIDLFILAEKVYAEQMSFVKTNYLILENKAIVPEIAKDTIHKHSKMKRFLYCGTITRHYGVFDAISFFKAISSHLAESELIIAGFAPDNRVFKELLSETITHKSIKIVGGNYLLTHNEILTEMMRADFVLLPYQSGQSLDGRIPTKMYECLSMEIPIIIAPNPGWNALVTENNAGIIHDYQTKPTSDLIEMLQHSFYGKGLTKNQLWATDEHLLLDRINSLFKVRHG